MLRRFYIMPVKPGVSDAHVQSYIDSLNAADMFMPGLTDSSAAIDFDSRTVLWEHNFADEQSYTGAYMLHPFHAATLDDALMADSPLFIMQDTYTVRCNLAAPNPRMEKGVRRIVILNLPEGADTSVLKALASVRSPDVATSAIYEDNAGFVSFKGRPWTHVWEQGFKDKDALDRYLRTREGIASSSHEALKRAGVDAKAAKILTCPFALKPPQSPTEIEDNVPIFYTIGARVALTDVDAYVKLLESLYDPYVVDGGGKLAHRWRTIPNGYTEAEVFSAWQLKSIASYNDLRWKLETERWKKFVTDAMPLVKGGTRRFYRAV